MKTKAILCFVAASALMASCTKEPIKNNAPAHAGDLMQTALFSHSTSTDPANVTKAQAFAETHGTKDFHVGRVAVQFDFADVSTVTLSNSTSTAFLANQVGYNYSNPINYSMAMYPDGYGNIKASMIIKTERISPTLLNITYYTSDNILIITGTMNLTTGIFSNVNTTGRMDVQNTGPGKGQAVANCIADAYANHGWISVWATVQSALIPATAVAITIACMM